MADRDQDVRYMRRALRLARRGEGYVEPNPMVGCVIVREGKVVGEGWHRKFGGPHAEVEALRAAGEAARGATAYVTLEPCSHEGKTPPCAAALVEAGVAEVVIGALEPTLERNGVGVRQMEAAGIDVRRGPLAEEAMRLIEPFAKRVLTGLPFMIGKWAATVDGAIATRDGDSRWISNERSRRLVHRLRGRVDAVLTGIGTVRADDPRLTARGVRPRRVARRVIIDPKLEVPAEGRLMGTIGDAPLTVAAGEAVLSSAEGEQRRRALEAGGAEVLGLPTREADGMLELRPLMRHLAEAHEATNVLAEGGGRTLGTLLEQELADELMVFIGPKLLGDPRHVAPVAWSGGRSGPGITRIEQATELQLLSSRRLGEDVMLRYRVPNRV